jgi:hypothetical protein
LDYEKPVSTGAQAKISIGSFWPFSTASTHNRHLARFLNPRIAKGPLACRQAALSQMPSGRHAATSRDGGVRQARAKAAWMLTFLAAEGE